RWLRPGQARAGLLSRRKCAGYHEAAHDTKREFLARAALAGCPVDCRQAGEFAPSGKNCLPCRKFIGACQHPGIRIWFHPMPTNPPDAIVCKPTPWFTLRAVAMLLMFSVFAAYFAFDGAVGYRNKNKEYFLYAAFKKAKDEFEAKNKESELT